MRQTGSVSSVIYRGRVQGVACSAGLTVDPQRGDVFGRKTPKEAARSNQNIQKIVQHIVLPEAATMKSVEAAGVKPIITTLFKRITYEPASAR